MAILKMAKDSNILENNMVQTQASAAGTLSAIIFIIPGMLMIGYWQGFEFWQTLIVSACGGCLGVLFTIPLRRAMVVHSDLAYPEGVAAAEILKVGSSSKEQQKGGSGLKEIFSGGALAGIVALCSNGFQVLGSQLSLWFSVGRGMTQLPLGYSTALVGAGYLVGIAAGLSMPVGILIAWAGFVPYYTITSALPDGMTMQKFAGSVYQQRVRLIGAGAMGVAAVWTLLTLARPVIDGVKESLAAVRMPDAEKTTGKHRMDIDMSAKSVGLVFLVTVVGLLCIFYAFVSPENLPAAETLTFTVVGVGVAVLMGFFVAAACAYMAGLVGTSSSPISGIGILAIIVASLVIAPVLNLLYEAYGFPGALPRPGMDPAQALAAPQAALMTTIAQGIFSGALEWGYIYIGIGLGVVLVAIDQFLKHSTKSLCLPPVVQTPLVVGAVLGYFLRKHLRAQGGEEAEAAGNRRGTLFASGLIVGESIIGVLLAGVIVVSVTGGGSDAPLALVGKDFAGTAEYLGLAVFAVSLLIFSKVVLGSSDK